MVEPIRATLGPLSRTVVVASIFDGKPPEVLDNGGVIARRIIELPDRDADMGAMIVRHLVSRVHDEMGDATATAAVLFETVFDQGVRYITAGGNAVLFRRYLEEGSQIILDEMTKMVSHLKGKENLAHLAESMCHDPPLGKMLGEIFDIIGEHGHLEIRVGASRELKREYVSGTFWSGGVLSREMLMGARSGTVVMENPALLLTDLVIEDLADVVALLEMAIESGVSSLVVLARKVSDLVIGLLVANNADQEQIRVIVVETPGSFDNRHALLDDMSIMIGGRPLLQAAGSSLRRVTPEDLGRARRVWADHENFGIVGGGGDARALRRRIRELQSAFGQAKKPDSRNFLRERMGKLMGGSATLWVDGSTLTEGNARKKLAERTADTLRSAVRAGVLPGGGVSLLDCRCRLQEHLDHCVTADERAAYSTLLQAIEVPSRTILTNAGYDASEIMTEIKQAGPGHGYDVHRGEVVDMVGAGIYDVGAAYQSAVRAAISGAAQALTIDVLVHREKPETVLDPSRSDSALKT